MTMKYLIAVLLQVIAFAVGMAEVIVPTFGVLAIVCIGVSVWSWIYILKELPGGAAIGFAIADLILLPFAIKFSFAYLAKSSMSHQSDLGTGSGLEGLDQELTRHVGELAVVEAQLRPTGKIRVGEEVYEAQTAGEWVAKGGKVRVVSVNGSRFHVEKA